MIGNSTEKNPHRRTMYDNSYESDIVGVRCTVYEGDMSSYWLDSIKHDTSYAPFYPTWIISAFALVKAAASMGVKHVIDIGSGDGRIAYCANIAGMSAYSVEIDENLVALQEKICASRARFEIKCADATQINYPESEHAVFFIGGLPEIGEMLAKGVIKKMLHAAESNNRQFTCLQIMNTNSCKVSCKAKFV